MDLQILCENIKKLRLEKGISQKEMAKHLRVGVKSLRKLERGEIPPRMKVDLMFRACEYFGITIGQLLSKDLSIKIK